MRRKLSFYFYVKYNKFLLKKIYRNKVFQFFSFFFGKKKMNRDKKLKAKQMDMNFLYMWNIKIYIYFYKSKNYIFFERE